MGHFLNILVQLMTILSLAKSICGEVIPGTPIVELSSGTVEGITMIATNGRPFSAFLSIPYAEPPIGPLRFKQPVKIRPWKGTFKADRVHVWCAQFGYRSTNDTEDCLVLNVYKPHLRTKDSHLLPVLLNIHEGALQFGSGSYDFYKPEKFMERDAILVTFNYRLGIFGFLNTMDEYSPGNYGMMDQVMVLHWVKDNIRKFGGDPNKVTLFGNSAGSACVTYHLISPLSNGLFQSAIAQSGSALNPWALQADPLGWAQKVGRLVNCPNVESTKLLIDCFREKSVYDFYQGRKAEAKYRLLYNIGPSVESSYGPGFLKKLPLVLLKQGAFNKVPVIAGMVRDEGRSFAQTVFDFQKTYGQEFLDNEFCGFQFMEMDTEPKEQCQEIVEEYFADKDVSDREVFRQGIIKLYGDSQLKAGISKTVELLVKAGVPIQTYIIDYVIEGNGRDKAPDNYVRHSDETTLLFDRKWSPSDVIDNTANDLKMARLITFIWAEFAMRKTNDEEIHIPGMGRISWPLYNRKTRKHLMFNLHPTVESGLLCDKMKFWIDIYKSLKRV